MIEVTDKCRCTGCGACSDICPVGCIRMQEDVEGFLYPSVDGNLCIGCSECEWVCPFNNHFPQSTPQAYAVRTSIDSNSSSGGALAALSLKWLKEGGCVFGAVFDQEMDVVHIKADSEEKLILLSSSKYVQSSLDGVFAQVRDTLSSGQKVLFVGTPCQVAGLRSFIGDAEGLLTVQLACHGVPSAKLWKGYLHSLQSLWGAKIQSVNFRDKSRGWKNYHVAYTTSSGITKVPFNQDTYMLAYLQNLSLRPSCYNCTFRSSACADLMAGDLWNAAELLKEYDDSRGFTLLCACTSAGAKVVDQLMNESAVVCIPVDYQLAIKGNSGFALAVENPQRRDDFFDGIYDSDDMLSHMDRFIERKSSGRILYEKIHTFLSKLKKKILG